LLLDPLSPGGDRRIVRAVYDVRDERPVARAVEVAPAPGVLVLDGIFLHRPALRDYWDYSVFLDVPISVSVARVARRGGGHPDPYAEVNRRYVQGQQLYLRSCEPKRRATVVLDNTDFEAPAITTRNDRGGHP
jgi:uridine kinase